MRSSKDRGISGNALEVAQSRCSLDPRSNGLPDTSGRQTIALGELFERPPMHKVKGRNAPLRFGPILP